MSQEVKGQSTLYPLRVNRTNGRWRTLSQSLLEDVHVMNTEKWKIFEEIFLCFCCLCVCVSGEGVISCVIQEIVGGQVSLIWVGLYDAKTGTNVPKRSTANKG